MCFVLFCAKKGTYSYCAVVNRRASLKFSPKLSFGSRWFVIVIVFAWQLEVHTDFFFSTSYHPQQHFSYSVLLLMPLFLMHIEIRQRNRRKNLHPQICETRHPMALKWSFCLSPTGKMAINSLHSFRWKPGSHLFYGYYDFSSNEITCN